MEFELKEGTSFMSGKTAVTLCEDAKFSADVTTPDQLAEVLSASNNLDANLDGLNHQVSRGDSKFDITYGAYGARVENQIRTKEEEKAQAAAVGATQPDEMVSQPKMISKETTQKETISGEVNADGEDVYQKLNAKAIHKEPLSSFAPSADKAAVKKGGVASNLDPEVRKQTGK